MKSLDTVYDEFLGILTANEDNDPCTDRTIYFSYEPSRYWIIERLFTQYPFSAFDHFVDFGCGKGRVLLLAAYYSCNHVTGYEINSETYQILCENICKFKKKFTYNTIFSTYNLNVETIEIDDTATKFFFFNPFHLKVYIKVVNKIMDSLHRRDRKVYLFLYNPMVSTIRYIDSLRYFKKIDMLSIHHVPRRDTDDRPLLVIYVYDSDEYAAP